METVKTTAARLDYGDKILHDDRVLTVNATTRWGRELVVETVEGLDILLACNARVLRVKDATDTYLDLRA